MVVVVTLVVRVGGGAGGPPPHLSGSSRVVSLLGIPLKRTLPLYLRDLVALSINADVFRPNTNPNPSFLLKNRDGWGIETKEADQIT